MSTMLWSTVWTAQTQKWESWAFPVTIVPKFDTRQISLNVLEEKCQNIFLKRCLHVCMHLPLMQKATTLSSCPCPSTKVFAKNGVSDSLGSRNLKYSFLTYLSQHETEKLHESFIKKPAKVLKNKHLSLKHRTCLRDWNLQYLEKTLLLKKYFEQPCIQFMHRTVCKYISMTERRFSDGCKRTPFDTKVYRKK